MTRCTFGNTNVFFYFPKFDRNRGSHWMYYMSHRISHVLLFTNYQAAILSHQLLKFHPFDWLIEIYLQTVDQGTHHNMVSLQPMPGFPLCWATPWALQVMRKIQWTIFIWICKLQKPRPEHGCKIRADSLFG